MSDAVIEKRRRTPLRARIYDRLVTGLTKRWYREVLERVAPGARLLDVGIGTAGALARNAALVREKQVRITGVDIDADYLRRARTRLDEHGLGELVDVRHEGIESHRGGPYDGVYFAASFMLLPDPVAMLRHAQALLAPEGRIYFTQTFHTRKSRLAERVKPALRRLTTIDFGTVTYEADFLARLEAGGVEVIEMTEMQRRGRQSYRLVVGKPRP